jgi:hypothetical protein
MEMGVRLRIRVLVSTAALAAVAAGSAGAEPLARDEVPVPLAPWVDWVLRGHEEARCPFLHGAGDRRACIWPSRLELDLDEGEGRFTQEWLVHNEEHVPLPGAEKRWPQEVRADGKAVPVVSVGGRPSARLPAGHHRVTGTFRWDALPELLQIPPETGIVRLRLRGREVPFAKRDAKGRLWLQKRAGAEGDRAEQRLEVTAHRRVVDEVPLRLETRVRLEVAGRSREVLLGRALPDGFVPLSLTSPLPARLDADGRLRVQVRPGTWRVALVARGAGPVGALALPDPGGPWDDTEVWVFDARPHLRLVTVEEGVPVDPAQTTLPGEWKHLPAYLMEPGRALRLAEKRRGDADPAPDQLTLSRALWLDFDGGGYTATDTIDGVVRRSTRLEMTPGTELGRVEIGGRDQLITRLDESPLAGVEVPQGRIQLEADSRVAAEGGLLAAAIPAIGWDHDFQGLEGRLHLPPGWRLLHAAGVDRASTTWLNRWTLLDLFAVLILTLVFFRLWTLRWGALALVGLALTWTEPGAPHWTWAAALAGEALRRALPEGRFPRFTRVVALYRGVALALLVLVSIPFAVDQVRAGLSPALERPRTARVAPLLPSKPMRQQALTLGAPEEAEAPAAAGAPVDRARMMRDEVAKRRESIVAEAAPAVQYDKVFRSYAPDPKARITTGPGLPAWQWPSVALRWSGPVERDQTLRLVLIGPFANGVLSFARVGLLAALLLCVIGVSAPAASRFLRPGVAAAAGVFAVALAAPGPARADIPSPELLEELRARLLENPECHPHCAASPRLALAVRPKALRARIEIHAQAETAVPLPGGARSWAPERVVIDGEPAAGLLRSGDGVLWARLAPGRHQIVVEGALPDRDSIELPLPLRPHRVEVRAEGWTVHGIHEDGLAEANLQLLRIREDGDEGDRALEAGELPPFVRVERTIRLGLEWQVATAVQRVSPAETALVLELPLLPGESVTTAGIRADGDRALVTMGPGVTRVTWSSLLAQRPQLVLRAPEDTPSAEVWRLDVSPVWHVDPSGIPPVHQPSPEGARIREWRPWPGEQVVLRVRRPAGVEGATATIDASELAMKPGLRVTDTTLSVTLRSSRGGQHAITLPEDGVLQRVAIDGAVQPIRQEGRAVSVPLKPGTQRVELSWREPNGARQLVYRGSAVDLGMPSVNADVRMAPSAGRWTLSAGGTRLGPAVLFWPLLVVFALVAFALARLCAATDAAPLRFHHWMLLGVGLTQVPVPAAALVPAWLLALGWRRQRGAEVPGAWFDLVQIGVAGLTAVALAVLALSIRQGLLGLPEMQIAGNGSTAALLLWYQDRAGPVLPQPWVASVPLLVYRLAMLAWALWLALALVRWLRWGWGCFSTVELWRPLRRGRVTTGASTPS